MRFWKQRKRVKPISQRPLQKRSPTQMNIPSKSKPKGIVPYQGSPHVTRSVSSVSDEAESSANAKISSLATFIPPNIVVPVSSIPATVKPDSIPVTTYTLLFAYTFPRTPVDLEKKVELSAQVQRVNPSMTWARKVGT
jgi:hypothetical protein